nr:FAD-dependent oxidoreductase [Lacticaseibacillus thailandensis]
MALADRPQSIGFIGAGYVAVELANIAAEAGVTVHIFQHNRRLLRAFPEEYAARVANQLQDKGVQWHWDTSITSVRAGADQGVIATTDHGDDVTLDLLVAAAGRDANIGSLNLEAAGIEYSRHGVKINDHLQSTVANVFAIGDAADKQVPKLTPTASFEGRYVADLINGATAPIQYPPVPHTVFAGPELAQVGLSLSAAQADSDRYAVLTQDVGSWYTYHRIRDDDARVTTITNRQTGLLVGAVALATNAEELINYCTSIITRGLPASALKQWIPVYPSVASDLGYFYS